MAPPAVGSTWKRLVFALVLAAALIGGGLLIWRNDPGAEANVALIDAVQKQTGLLLAADGAQLDPASGMWRAENVALRTSASAEPVLRARKVELKLTMAELLRGQVRIERASAYGAVLALDLRPTAAAGPALDRARLAQWLPREAEVPDATVVLKTAGFELKVEGLALALKREGEALKGPLIGNAARAVLDASEPLPLKVEAQVAWTASGLAIDALTATAGKSVLHGALTVTEGVVASLAGDAVTLEELRPLVPASVGGHGRIQLRVTSGQATVGLELERATVKDYAFEKVTAKVQAEHDALVVRELEAHRGAEHYRAEELRLGRDFTPNGTVHVETLALSEALSRAGIALKATGTASGDITLQGGGASVALELSAPAFGAYRFESGKLDARIASFTAPGFEIAQLELRSAVASIVLSGKADAAGKLALAGKAHGSLGGRAIEVDVDVRGTAEKPETTLQLAGVEAARAGYSLRAELSGTQLVRGHLELKNADFSGQLPAIENAGAPNGRIDARIELTRGSLDDLRAFEGQGEIEKLVFGYGDITFASVASFPIVLRNGRIQLSDVTLEAGDTSWTLDGELDVERGADLSATSELPLAPLLVAAPFVESADGELRITLRLRGAGNSLALTGEALPRNVALALGPMKTPWTNVQGKVSLEDGALKLRDVTGGFGTGTLTLSGPLALAGIKPKAADLKLALRDFSYSPQPRFDIALAADSTLKWSAGDALPVLGGTVTLSRMHYGRHVQLPEAVIALGKRDKHASEPTVAIDLRVAHSTPLTVRNDFLDVELEATGKDKSVRVVGTDARLGAIGELTVTRGRALFRGATLTVRRGVITFKSETSIVPALDLLADAPAKRRPGGLIHFTAKGDPARFDIALRCEANGAVPPPFTCAYAGDEMTCGNFAELTGLWACQEP